MHESEEQNDSILIFHNDDIITVSFGDGVNVFLADLVTTTLRLLLNTVSIL